MGSDDVRSRWELEELKTGLSFGVEYLGYVPVTESLRNVSQKDRITNCCMRMVGHQLNLIPGIRSDEEFSTMLGKVVLTRKNITLNMALYAFILMDENDVLLERHPTDLVSFASFAYQSGLKGFFCFISHPSEEKGRRCLVFRTSDETIDFIHKTLDKIFNHNGQKKTTAVSVSPRPETPVSNPGVYVNVLNSVILSLPVARGLEQQPWFHGVLERPVAEAKLHNEGDFLVRWSKNTTNNFVLSVIANSSPRHLLLLDEEDQKVRKQEQVFETVVELIEHHLQNNIPIVTDESKLILIQPIENDISRARHTRRPERMQEPLIQRL